MYGQQKVLNTAEVIGEEQKYENDERLSLLENNISDDRYKLFLYCEHLLVARI